MTLTSLLAFVSTAILARPKPGARDAQIAAITELKIQVGKLKKTRDSLTEALARRREEGDALEARNKDLLLRLAEERHERSALLGRLAQAEAQRMEAQLRADHWATMYAGMQPPALWPIQQQNPEQLRAQSAPIPPGGIVELMRCAPGGVVDMLRPVDLSLEMLERARRVISDPGHWHGRCTCTPPGRSALFRRPEPANLNMTPVQGTHADRIIVDDPFSPLGEIGGA